VALNLTGVSAPKISWMEYGREMPFTSENLTPLSTMSPSPDGTMGVWETSWSQRYTDPGEMILTGGSWDSITLTCMGDV